MENIKKTTNIPTYHEYAYAKPAELIELLQRPETLRILISHLAALIIMASVATVSEVSQTEITKTDIITIMLQEPGSSDEFSLTPCSH